MTLLRRGEDAWIDFITRLWGDSGAEVGIGHDACVLPKAGWAVTTDAAVEGVDFELSWAPPEALGHKIMAANLSDLAAVGAVPRFALLTLGIPPSLPDAAMEDLLRGMRALCARSGVGLAGGDLSSSPGGLFVSVTLLGEPAGAPLLRSGGLPGHDLYLGGAVGGPAEALARFGRGARLAAFDSAQPPRDPEEAILDRFYRPPDQGALGVLLASERLASCAMDVSDGLLKDLGRLCAASGCGAEVDLAAVPTEPARDPILERAALRQALGGGEEQVLLFAAKPESAVRLKACGIPVRRIGRLVNGEGIHGLWPDGQVERLAEEGWDHFAP